MSINWYGPQIVQQFHAEMRRRIMECSRLVQTHAKDLVNVEGTGKRTARSRKIKTWKGTGAAKTWTGKYHRKAKGSLIYGANPSKPGEPPHKQTGRLYISIVWEMASQFVGRVGTNLKYGKWLEKGTRKMAARPWLGRALAEMRDRINKTLSAPIKLR